MSLSQLKNIDKKGIMRCLGWVKLQKVFFRQKRWLKKRYHRNEGLGLAWI